ncbi:MAG: hypothetical protein PVG14_11905 [Anaerolineales bacterium]|jgi:hypothetical protein
MTTKSSEGSQEIPPEIRTGIFRRAVQVFVMLAVQGVIFLLSAGRLNWEGSCAHPWKTARCRLSWKVTANTSVERAVVCSRECDRRLICARVS